MGGEEVGVNCGCMQECCVGARPGVRSWRSMVQVTVTTKTNRVGDAVRQSLTRDRTTLGFGFGFGFGLPFFLFLLFETVTQLARRVQPNRTQVVCSNKVDRRRLAQRHSRNKPWTCENSFDVYIHIIFFERDIQTPTSDSLKH